MKTVKCTKCGKTEEVKGRILPPGWVGFFSFSTFRTEQVFCPECWAKIKESKGGRK